MSVNIGAYSYTIGTDTTGQVRGLLLSRWGVVLISPPQPTTDDAWCAARELYDRWCSSWFSSQRDEATITARAELSGTPVLKPRDFVELDT